MASDVVQMNVRLDVRAKKRVDDLAQRAGYTSSQFLRLLWNALAQPENNEDTLQHVLDAATPENRVKESAASPKSKAWEGAHFIEESLKRYGISSSSLPHESEQEHLKDLIMEERYGECGL